MHAAPRTARDRRYSTQLWRNTRDRVLRRDGYRCLACGREGSPSDTRHLVADHKLAPSRGGEFYDTANLWTLCRACNYSKGTQTVDEWATRTGTPFHRPQLTVAGDPRHGPLLQPSRASRTFAELMALPLVKHPPHRHGRWACGSTLYARGGAVYLTCPRDCPNPARWPKPPLT